MLEFVRWSAIGSNRLSVSEPLGLVDSNQGQSAVTNTTNRKGHKQRSRGNSYIAISSPSLSGPSHILLTDVEFSQEATNQGQSRKVDADPDADVNIDADLTADIHHDKQIKSESERYE